MNNDDPIIRDCLTCGVKTVAVPSEEYDGKYFSFCTPCHEQRCQDCLMTAQRLAEIKAEKGE